MNCSRTTSTFREGRETRPLCILKLCRADLLYGILINDVLGNLKAPPLTATYNDLYNSIRQRRSRRPSYRHFVVDSFDSLDIPSMRIPINEHLHLHSTTSSATASVTKFIERELPAVLVVAFMHDAPLAPPASHHSVPFTGTAASKFIHNSRSRRE